MRPSELSNLLWAQVDRVAPHLLPNGKKEGHEWVAGNVNGDKGNSLKVNLSGKKKWADFAEGDGGDMLDLWMACRGINLHQAMQEAKAFLGIKDDDHHFDAKREKKFSRPDRKKIARYVTRTESHLEYLQSRGISPEVVKRYEVVSGKVWNGERELDALVLPYKREGEQVQVKRTDGIFGTLGNYVSQLSNGKMLNNEQVQDLINTSKLMANTEGEKFNQQMDDYLSTYGDSLPSGLTKQLQSRKAKLYEDIQQPAQQQTQQATSGGQTFREGMTAKNPKTGQKIIYRNGQWQPM